jgi:hypothetical protein
MEFMQVFGACHNFAMAHGGTIAAFPVGQEKFVLESRTGRTEILIERDPAQPGGWLAEQRQDVNGERNPVKARFDTEPDLLRCVLGFWQAGMVYPPRLSQVLESPASLAPP